MERILPGKMPAPSGPVDLEKITGFADVANYAGCRKQQNRTDYRVVADNDASQLNTIRDRGPSPHAAATFTSPDVATSYSIALVLRPAVRFVRDEEVAGSIPFRFIARVRLWRAAPLSGRLADARVGWSCRVGGTIVPLR
jgi:hypothetical protein